MKKILQLACTLALLWFTPQICIADDPPANAVPQATVTFLSNAQSDGRIIIDITYDNGKKDKIVSTKIFPEGTTPAEKTAQLISDINAQQTQGVEATADINSDGTIKLYSLNMPGGGNNFITGMQISDGTKQLINANPQGIAPSESPINLSFLLSGYGSCIDAILLLTFDVMGINASVSTYEKSAWEVTTEMAGILSDLLAPYEASVFPVQRGDDGGELLIIGIPPDMSEFTINTGGDCGIDSVISFFTEDEMVIPTLTEWGIILFVLATLGIGVFRIFRL